MSVDIALLTASRLYSAVSANEKKTNFVLSPFSILGVFHMAQRGAAGDTKMEMDKLVATDSDFKLPFFSQNQEAGDPAVVVEAANRLYGGKSLEGNDHFKDFNAELQLAMSSDAKTLDFAQPLAAAQEINNFVKEKTRDHITNLIDASLITEATRLLLINALYFKAPWNSQFQPEATDLDVFYALTAKGLEEQRVKFMHQQLKRGFTYLDDTEVTAFSMNYADSRLRMCVYMPEDIESFESKLSIKPEYIEELASRLRDAHCADKELKVGFPKFKLSAVENFVDLVPIFRGLGTSIMFDPGHADFSGITGNRDLSVSGYVHQADIAVDEEGTEATAATAMLMGATAFMLPKPVIRLSINKPFLFQVRFEEEGRSPHILFCGRIADVAAAQ